MPVTFADVRARFPKQFPQSARIECGPGWAGIVARFLEDVGDVTVHAVRQKMGVLRIEADGSTDDTHARLLAEFRSRVTCEECGSRGHMRVRDGWKRCRCDGHCTPEEYCQPPRPAWTMGRATTKGYLWYDPETDAVRIIDNLASIGMPARYIQALKTHGGI